MTPFWRENQLNDTQKTKELKKERELMIWRTKMQVRIQGKDSTQGLQFASNESKLVRRNLDP
jgi:hypothetical protein